MFKNILLIIVAVVFYTSISAQNLTPTDAGSKISFVIKNLGINVNGTLSGLKGTIKFDPKKLSTSLFDVTVDVNTINTNNTRRDEHLKKDDFFDVQKYPTIAIKSTSIRAKGNNTYFAKAVLTMHGVSKNIQFDFIAKPSAKGYQFTGGFAVNRRTYGVGGNSMTMSDDVKIMLNVAALK